MQLEQFRTARLVTAGLVIQKHVRGWIARRNYTKQRAMVILLQSLARRWLARQTVNELRNRSRKPFTRYTGSPNILSTRCRFYCFIVLIVVECVQPRDWYSVLQFYLTMTIISRVLHLFPQ